MEPTEIGNCRHHYRFTSANYSGGSGGYWEDLVGGAADARATIDSGTPTYDTANSLQGIDISGGYLTVPEMEILGEFSVISVIGYRGGGLAYGWATQSTITGFNWREQVTGNTYNFWRGAGTATPAQLVQSHVNVIVGGVDVVNGKSFSKVDQHTAVERTHTQANDTVVNGYSNIQFGRYGTTNDPVQRLYESTFYIGDIRNDDDFDTVITDLMTKYDIPS